ncbi:dihydrouridine synthase (dus) protein [Cardiosporidium cionae]|uniref:tRNA-dihydrouridine(16/17) synthase [NAD(P)(+)] n=1 Tax=Cardiosporidium cionae TaxID=476202 RepID=A0ABQ7JBS8_9APIC|nr:dihydrouridine synthase (dus) protein [Cardiosporidium cionae]|eukprot:KAF8821369.1 dihydrouridine synthase (dus) protein [Cardiosporidium cionae]
MSGWEESKCVAPSFFSDDSASVILSNADTYTKPGKKFVQQHAFWKSLGNPRYVVAPMVELSELAFRMLCRHFKADLTYTPMLHSIQFLNSAKYRDAHFDIHPSDHPIFAQFCGNDPDVFATVASLVHGHVEAIDINLGCPQGIAKRGHYGSFLLQQPDLITRIVTTIKQSVSIPVTCKIRKVSDDLQQTVNLCYALEACGCDALCVHGRTKEEKAQQTKEFIANGGIETYSDAERCFASTRVDAVMSAEGILDYPPLFTGNNSYDRLFIAEKYINHASLTLFFKIDSNSGDYILDFNVLLCFQPSCFFLFGFPPRSNGCIKAHLFRLLHGQLQSYPEIRTGLATATSLEDCANTVDSLKRQSFAAVLPKWYRRYRQEDIC